VSSIIEIYESLISSIPFTALPFFNLQVQAQPEIGLIACPRERKNAMENRRKRHISACVQILRVKVARGKGSKLKVLEIGK
jgi:hypothetical protein